MIILSISILDHLDESLNNLIKDGIASDKNELINIAINAFVEDKAYQDILKAIREPFLSGDLGELAKNIE